MPAPIGFELRRISLETVSVDGGFEVQHVTLTLTLAISKGMRPPSIASGDATGCPIPRGKQCEFAVKFAALLELSCR
jgi:hypothetical protein